MWAGVVCSGAGSLGLMRTDYKHLLLTMCLKSAILGTFTIRESVEGPIGPFIGQTWK